MPFTSALQQQLQAPRLTPAALSRPSARPCMRVAANKTSVAQAPSRLQDSLKDLAGLGDGVGGMLGPIGLSIGSMQEEEDQPRRHQQSDGDHEDNDSEASTSSPPRSIASMTTAEWRAKYEKDGHVDLWVEEEFNSGSRLVGGRAEYLGGMYGIATGEGPSVSEAPRHHVVIHNHFADQVVEVDVPEDRYILWEAEDEGLQLPYACRMGCCTACAVKVKEGEVYQPEALGVSDELRRQGYALMCVGFPLSDCVLETVPEDEVYDLQFGQNFAEQALDPSANSIMRDDFALEIAQMDE